MKIETTSHKPLSISINNKPNLLIEEVPKTVDKYGQVVVLITKHHGGYKVETYQTLPGILFAANAYI